MACIELKCFATGFSRRRCLISERWPFIRKWSAFSVSPTYCFLLHFSLVVKYVLCFQLLCIILTTKIFLNKHFQTYYSHCCVCSCSCTGKNKFLNLGYQIADIHLLAYISTCTLSECCHKNTGPQSH